MTDIKQRSCADYNIRPYGVQQSMVAAVSRGFVPFRCEIVNIAYQKPSIITKKGRIKAIFGKASPSSRAPKDCFGSRISGTLTICLLLH